MNTDMRNSFLSLLRFENYELFKSPPERIILGPLNRRDSIRFFDDRDSANSLGFARAGRRFPDDVRRCIGCSGGSPLGVLHEPSYIPVITVISVAAARPRTRWRRSVDNEVGRGHDERGFSLVRCRLIRVRRRGVAERPATDPRKEVTIMRGTPPRCTSRRATIITELFRPPRRREAVRLRRRAGSVSLSRFFFTFSFSFFSSSLSFSLFSSHSLPVAPLSRGYAPVCVDRVCVRVPQESASSGRS